MHENAKLCIEMQIGEGVTRTKIEGCSAADTYSLESPGQTLQASSTHSKCGATSCPCSHSSEVVVGVAQRWILLALPRFFLSHGQYGKLQ